MPGNPSYARTNHLEGAMSVSGMVALRQHCKDGISEGLSNMSGGLATTLEYAPGVAFTDNLTRIARQTVEAKQNPLVGLDGIPMIHTVTKTAPMWVLLKAADTSYSFLSLSLTNLGNILRYCCYCGMHHCRCGFYQICQ